MKIRNEQYVFFFLFFFLFFEESSDMCIQGEMWEKVNNQRGSGRVGAGGWGGWGKEKIE